LKTVVKKLYEAMFLIDSAQAASDWDGSLTTIKNILEKAGAEIVSIRKWDECKLAYEIKGKSRGTYILCYFRAEGERVREIERNIQLSERIMRALILCAEAMSQEDIEKDTPVMQAEKRAQQLTEQAAKRTQEAQAVQADAEDFELPAEDVEDAEEDLEVADSEEAGE